MGWLVIRLAGRCVGFVVAAEACAGSLGEKNNNLKQC